MAHPIEITDANFQELVLNSDKPVLVDFWAKWCGPCVALTPTIEQLAVEFDGLAVVGKLDIDKNPNTSTEYAIMSIPAILIFKGGKVVNETVGLVGKDVLTGKLSTFTNSAS